MQTPPPFQPPGQSPPPAFVPPAPPRKGLPAWGWALFGCGCLSLLMVPILAAILFPVFAKAREQARQASCATNEKQMSLALLQYAQDNDESLPSTPNWMDVTATYRGGSDQALHCPAVGQDPSKYGYAFNSALKSRNLNRIPSPQAVPMVFDSGNLERNATDAGGSLPNPPRHGGGNNLAFADGHVKWARTGGP